MAIETFPITPSINLNAIQTQKFKTNILAVKLIVALDKENASFYSLLCRVIKQGTENYPSITELSRKSQELYSLIHQVRTFKAGSDQIIEFSVDYLKAAFIPDQCDICANAVQILNELLFHPLLCDDEFSPAYVEREKQGLCDAIRSRINNKGAYALHRLIQQMCKEEAYGISAEGEIDIIEQITPKTLYRAYRELLNTAKIELYFVGDENIPRLIELLKPIFSKQNFITELPKQAAIKRKEIEMSFEEIREAFPVKQSKLCMGFRLNRYISDADWTASLVFCELFGASPQSKLFMHVREKLSLCYYCSAGVIASNGIMIVQSGIDRKNCELVKKAVCDMLHEIQNGNFTAAELADAKRSLINNLLETQDSAVAMENWYFIHGLYQLNIDIPEQVQMIQDISREQVIRAAQEISADTLYFLEGTLDQSSLCDDEEEHADE